MCMYIIRYRLCFLSKTEYNCIFFQKLNADLIFYPTVMGELMSAHPSLLEVTVAMDVLTSSRLLLLESTVISDGFCYQIFSNL
jgi:hypothetical protein